MTYYKGNELYHHGIKGQKWGVRRYQNADGTLTDVGQNRYGRKERREKKGISDKTKKAIKNGLLISGTILAAYGTYKIADNALEKNYTKQLKAANDFVSKLGKEYRRENFAANINYVKSNGRSVKDKYFLDRNNKRQLDIAEQAYNQIIGQPRYKKFDPSKLGNVSPYRYEWK